MYMYSKAGGVKGGYPPKICIYVLVVSLSYFSYFPPLLQNPVWTPCKGWNSNYTYKTD